MPAPKGNQNAKGNKGGGRTTSYLPKYATQAKRACQAGFTEKEICELIGCSTGTLHAWKVAHVEFAEALKVGKGPADDRVEISLFHRAVGYSHPDVDIRVIDGQIVKTEIVKHYPPDTTAGIFWLKNRRKTDWRDKVDVGHGVEEGSPMAALMSALAGKVLKPVSDDQ